MTNGTDGGYMASHGAPFSGLGYGSLTLNSLNSSPAASPNFTQEALKSPITPCDDLSPLVDMPKAGGGPWLGNHLGRNTPNPWMPSAQSQSEGADMSSQVNQHSRMYPFSHFPLMNSSDMSAKSHGSALQRLDSFTQAFPNQNHLGMGLLRSNSLSTDNGSPSGLEDNSPMLLSPQAASPIDHALYGQSSAAQRFNQALMNHPGQPVDHQISSPLLGRSQSQYDYTPQQQVTYS